MKVGKLASVPKMKERCVSVHKYPLQRPETICELRRQRLKYFDSVFSRWVPLVTDNAINQSELELKAMQTVL